MSRVRLAAFAGSAGALFALMLVWGGVLSAASLSALSPFNDRRASEGAVRAYTHSLESAPVFAGDAHSASPSRVSLELVSLWRAGERAGVLIKQNDGQPHQLRIGESLGDIELVAVRDGAAVFSASQRQYTLRVHQRIEIQAS